MFNKFKALILFMFVVTLITAGFTACTKYADTGTPEPPSANKPPSEDYVPTDSLPVTRALVAKMLALAFNSKITIETLDREVPFSDTSPEDWYDKYINTCYIQGLMSGKKEGFFEPDEYLTLEQAQYLIDRIDKNNKIRIKITKETKEKPISYALWTELYTRALKNAYNDSNLNLETEYGLIEDSFIIMTTADDYDKLKPWVAITDKGMILYEGLPINTYTDTKIRVLKKDNEIVALLELQDTSPTISNAYVVNNTPEYITIFTGGVSKRYKHNLELGSVSGKIADLKINGGNAYEIQIHENTASGIIKLIDGDSIELYHEGETKKIPLADTKVYFISENGPKWRELKDIISGGNNYTIFLENDEAHAVTFNEVKTPESIRVAISTTGFSSLVHESVEITSDTDYSVEIGGAVSEYTGGDVFTVSKDENGDLFGQERIYIKPLDDEGKIQIKSIKRDMPDNPKYRGVIEIGKKNGGFTIVNELPLEQYLYNVVPSEMPASYGLEGLKVQAVAARSYAYNQFYTNKYAAYGGNINDSAASQVYNNIPEHELANTAIDETRGQCASYDGEVITAFYFSTSSGVTANSGEVWSDRVTKRFPAGTPEYLMSKEQYVGADYGDLTIEENMASFIKSSNIKSYDTHSSWFRWNITMTKDELSASINKNLKQRYDMNPSLVKTLQNENIYRSRPVESIGNIKDIEVTKRGAGGVVMEIKITGDKNTILVSTQTAITNLIRPVQYINEGAPITVNLMNGSAINSICIPSGFFIIEKNLNDDGTLKDVRFLGGGYGHGVGMSQNGTLGMVREGHLYTDILKHFYNGTEIKNIY